MSKKVDAPPTKKTTKRRAPTKPTTGDVLKVPFADELDSRVIYFRWTGKDWEANLVNIGDEDPYADVVSRVQMGEYEIVVRKLRDRK
jgi:hypothetical protein